MNEPVSPIINELNAPFWAAAKQGRLVLPYCLETQRCFWPPSPLSPFVNGGAVAWQESAGEGTLRGLVVYRRVFQKAFQERLPYGIGLVQLDEGPRLQAFVADPERAGAPRAGDRVILRFAHVVEDGP